MIDFIIAAHPLLVINRQILLSFISLKEIFYLSFVYSLLNLFAFVSSVDCIYNVSKCGRKIMANLLRKFGIYNFGKHSSEV